MQPEFNPYRPGAGARPPELAGRSAEVNYFDMLIIRTKHRSTDRPMVMSGLRGVGKTALITKFAEMADTHQWICVSLEGQAGTSGIGEVRRRLAAEVKAALVRFSMRHRARKGLDDLLGLVGSFSLDVGPISVERRIEPAATGLLDIDLEELVTAISKVAQERECGFALFIDEMQDVDPELLSALLVVQHRMQQRDLPFYVIGTGLPNLPATLADARSYAERLFRYVTVDPLSREEAAQALVLPARRLNCEFEQDALDYVLDAADGYPYFLQEYGKAVWDLADQRPFTISHARDAVIAGDAQLDAGFFPARWERATAKERSYMVAMAGAEDAQPRTSEVASLLGQSLAELSPVRGTLIRKGLIFAPERGRVAFTVPGMSAYLKRAPRFDE